MIFVGVYIECPVSWGQSAPAPERIDEFMITLREAFVPQGNIMPFALLVSGGSVTTPLRIASPPGRVRTPHQDRWLCDQRSLW